jgi:hypothetical protein
MLTLSRESAEPQSPARAGLHSRCVSASPSSSADRRVQWQARTHGGAALQVEGEPWADGLGINLTLTQDGDLPGSGRLHQAQLHLHNENDRQGSWPLGQGGADPAGSSSLTLILTLSEVPNSRRVNLWATCMLSADEAVHQVIGQWQRGPGL